RVAPTGGKTTRSECMSPGPSKSAPPRVRLGEHPRPKGRPPLGDERPSASGPGRIEARRRTLRSGILTGVLAIGGLVGFGATIIRAQGPKSPESGTVARESRGRLDNQFPTIAPPPLLTLADSGGGNATVLGKVTDSFTVTIDFNHPVGDGFVLVSK